MGCSDSPSPSLGGGRSTPSVFSSRLSVAKGDFDLPFAACLSSVLIEELIMSK